MSTEPQVALAVERRPGAHSPNIELDLLQQPNECRVAGRAETDKPAKASKWPLDPAPVVEFKLHDGDAGRSYLHSPFWFCSAALEPVSQSTSNSSSALSGCLVSSLHKVKLQDNIGEHGLFIFGDLHARIPGKFRLRFTLYELRSHSNAASSFVATLATKYSDIFTIHTGKLWPGQSESTSLSRHLCDSGVKLRIRKETSKRKAQGENWSSDKRTAISSFALPNPMGPPPTHRRRMTGEAISPDQVRFSGGLGIKSAMDREPYIRNHSQHASGNTTLNDYPNTLVRSGRYTSTSDSYSGPSISAPETRTLGLYNPTPYATLQYTPGQSGYSDSPGTLNSRETKYGIDSRYYPFSGSSGSGLGSNIGTSGLGTLPAYNPSSDIDRYSMGASFSPYGDRSGYGEPSTSYEDDRAGRSMLLAESIQGNGGQAWNSALSNIATTHSS